jgi:hypothetical protein
MKLPTIVVIAIAALTIPSRLVAEENPQLTADTRACWNAQHTGAETAGVVQCMIGKGYAAHRSVDSSGRNIVTFSKATQNPTPPAAPAIPGVPSSNAQHISTSRGTNAQSCREATGALRDFQQQLNGFWGASVRLCIGSGGSRYQPSDQIVFFDPDQFSHFSGARWSGSVKATELYVLAHEWGHYVQHFDARQYQMFKPSFEMQADCLAGYYIGSNVSLTQPEHSFLITTAAQISDKWWDTPDHGNIRFWALQRGIAGSGGKMWQAGPPAMKMPAVAACDRKYFDAARPYNVYRW